MRSRFPDWTRTLLLALAVPLLVGLVWANYRFALEAPGGNDFLARWMGARFWLVEGISPYDPRVSLASQERIYGREADPGQGEDIAHFVYPMPAMLFFAPFGYLEYPLARALWMTLLEIGLPVLAILGLRLARWWPGPAMTASLLLFSVVWYHGLRSIVVGQFAVIEALLMIGALLAIQGGLDFFAGGLLALSISKPQMSFILIPYILLWSISKRRWSILTTCLLGSLGLLVGSILVLPDWPLQWLRQLVDYPSYTFLGSPVSIAAGILPRGSGIVTIALTLTLAAYLLWEWIQSFGKGIRWFQWTAALTIVITNLIAFRTATTNFVVMIPALCLIFANWSDRWGARGRVAVFASLIILVLGLWWLFLRSVAGNVESAVMYIPVPFLTLIGLWWSRWWAIRSPRLPMD